MTIESNPARAVSAAANPAAADPATRLLRVFDAVCGRAVAYGVAAIATEISVPAAYSPAGLVAGLTAAAAIDATCQAVRLACALARTPDLRGRLQASARNAALSARNAVMPPAPPVSKPIAASSKPRRPSLVIP